MSNRKTVLVGLSGGVDSSVAALLLKKQGYNVIGCFMKNFSDTKNPLTGECSWINERKMAQRVASMLKIKLITIDYENQYKKQVKDPKTSYYLLKGIDDSKDQSYFLYELNESQLPSILFPLGNLTKNQVR